MKKTLILALAAISLSSANAVASNDSNLITTSFVNPVEKSIGTITELTLNGGKFMDLSSGEIRDFYHPGAQVDFKVGDSVSYVLITFPNGKPPVVIEIKKPS